MADDRCDSGTGTRGSRDSLPPVSGTPHRPRYTLIALTESGQAGPLPENLLEDEVECICRMLICLGRELLVNPLQDWQLSVRACNVLRRVNVTSLYELRHIPVEHIARMEKCGVITIGEIVQESLRYGVELPNWLRALSEAQRKKYQRH